MRFLSLYETTKLVAIRDARLACLRVTFLVAITLYVIIVELIGSGGYLQPSPLVGVTRFSLQHPTRNDCDPSNPLCKNDFTSLLKLKYCSQAGNASSNYKGYVFPCQIYESINAQLVSERSIVVITRASAVNQTLVCSADENICERTYKDQTEEQQKFYTAESERFTLLFDHAVSSSKICASHSTNDLTRNMHYACSAESSRYSGRLYSRNQDLCEEQNKSGKSFSSNRGSEVAYTAPCFIEPNHTDTNLDFFTLDTILRAAGVQLDDCSMGLDHAGENLVKNNETCKTYRETGATLLLNIYWSDFVPYRGLQGPSYFYSPQLIAGSSFKQYVPYYESYRSQRQLLNAHGIKIAVLLGGEFNQFDIVSFLVTLTTAVGLLAVATTIVDLLMLYVLPEKQRYQEAKYENTEEIDGQNIVSGLIHQIARTDRQDRDEGRIDRNGIEDAGQAGLQEPLLDDTDSHNSASNNANVI